MKQFRIGAALLIWVSVCGGMQGCKKACDDLEDVCASCSSDYRSDCDLTYEMCDIIKGKAGNDCCEAVLDEWKDSCI